MELSTPLPPTSLLPASPLASNASPYVEPPSIPLPPSPELFDVVLQHSPPLSVELPYSPPTAAAAHFQSTTDYTLEHLERELAAANEQLEGGEHEYQYLQNLAEDLRRQILDRNSRLLVEQEFDDLTM